MRICFLAAASSINTKNWALSFAKRGHDVHIITFHYARIGNVMVHLVDFPALPFKMNYLLSIPRIRAILSHIKPDIVVGYYLTSYGFVSAIAGGYPLVLAAAGSDINGRFPRSILDKLFLHYALKKPNKIISWAGHMTQRLIEYGANKENIVTLPRGVDTGQFYPGNELDIAPKEKVKLISTRSLKEIYNHPLLLKAINLTLKRGVKVESLFLGDGPEKKSLVRLAANLGISNNVRFLGAVNYDKVALYLRRADIYVSTSLSDGASASLFEAMASGVFPIVGNIPANREWITDGVNGFLIPTNKPEILSDRIIKANQNPSLRNCARQKNLEIIRQRVSQTNNSVKMEECLTQLIQRQTRHGLD